MALNTTGFGLSTAGAAFGVAAASATTAGIIGVTGALFFVGKAVKSGTTSLKGPKY